LFWPLLIFVIGVVPTVQVGKIEKMFMAQLGYAPRTPPPATPSSDPFTDTMHGGVPPENPVHQMQMGDYSLGQNITGLAGLTEISQSEYAVFPKTFPREKIFRAADITFLGFPWNLVLGTVDSFIHKLSAQFMSDLRDMAAAAFSESVMYCSNQFGKPSLAKQGAIAKWHTSFGNIIVDTGSALGQHYVNFQVTSGSLVRRAASASPLSPIRAVLNWVRAKLARAAIPGSSPQPVPDTKPVPDPIIPPPVRTQRSAKVSVCIRTIESELLKRTLSETEENNVAELCGALLSMALGDEKIVIRLVKLEWTESVDVIDALRRAQSRWERDHNRFG
jgi:hypothetical protein